MLFRELNCFLSFIRHYENLRLSTPLAYLSASANGPTFQYSLKFICLPCGLPSVRGGLNWLAPVAIILSPPDKPCGIGAFGFLSNSPWLLARLAAVLKERKRLSNNLLKKQKYNLIKEIKKNYNTEDFFKMQVSNYPLNASIYCLFEGASPSNQVRFRYSLLENITNKKVIKNKIDETYDIYSKQDKEVRMLSYKILLEKFNEKYGKLGKKQKSLLKEYIENISNTEKLNNYVYKEINNTTSKIDTAAKHVKNNVVKIKLNEVSSQLHLIKQDKKIKDKHIISVLRAYDLIKELANVIK